MSTIFYAWQNDTPQDLNRFLIRDALEAALSHLRKDVAIDDAPELDYDTKGVSGTPNIAETIFAKIQACAAFVADVSFVGATTSGEGVGYPKLLPNPNVLIELGMAGASVGWGRILLVMNTVFGKPDLLPFDLRHRRFPIQYVCSEASKAANRKELAAALAQALKPMLPTSTAVSALVHPMPSTTGKPLGDAPDSNVVATIRARAEAAFPDDLSTRKYQIDTELEAWRGLSHLTRPPDIPAAAFEIITKRAAADFPQDFGTQLYQVNQEFAAFNELRTFRAPGIPPEVFSRVTDKARNDFPEQFGTQLYQLKRELAAWRAMYRPNGVSPDF
jgi:hypothetical protein